MIETNHFFTQAYINNKEQFDDHRRKKTLNMVEFRKKKWNNTNADTIYFHLLQKYWNETAIYNDILMTHFLIHHFKMMVMMILPFQFIVHLTTKNTQIFNTDTDISANSQIFINRLLWKQKKKKTCDVSFLIYKKYKSTDFAMILMRFL